MKMMMLSGNLNRITEPDAFSSKPTGQTVPNSSAAHTNSLNNTNRGTAKENHYKRWYVKTETTPITSYENEFETIRGLIEAEEKLAKAYGVNYTYGLPIETPLKDLMKTDLISFCIYLANADGRITAKEASLISTVMGPVSANDLEEIADEVYEHEKETDMPLSLKLLTLAEKKLGMFGVGTHAKICIRLIDSFEGFGKALIAADGIPSEVEKKALNRYIRKMRQGASAIMLKQD